MMYVIIVANTLYELQTFVNKSIADGYKPQGGVGYQGQFFQAMVKA